MKNFIIGLIAGAILTVAGLYYFEVLDFGSMEIGPDEAASIEQTIDPPLPDESERGGQLIDPVIPGPLVEVTPDPSLECLASAVDCHGFTTNGFSGMAHVSDSNSFLVVHDWKASADRIGGTREYDFPRLGMLTANVANDGTTTHRYDVISIAAKDWTDADVATDARVATDAASDLESACSLSFHPGEFLVAESGRDQNTRRVFHIRLGGMPGPTGVTASVVEELALPNAGSDPYEFEGMACTYIGNRQYFVVMGQRGDTAAVPLGKLYVGTYTVGDTAIVWDTTSTMSVEAPQSPQRYRQVEWRDISGLHIDRNQNLWASAAFDTDDTNVEFHSVIYRVGIICVTGSNSNPVFCVPPLTGSPVAELQGTPSAALRTFSTYKVEAIESSSLRTTTDEQVYLTTASEDEFRRRRDDGSPAPNGVWWPDIFVPQP